MVTDSPDFIPQGRSGPYLKAVSPNPYQLQVERLMSDGLRGHQLDFEVLSEDLNQSQQLLGVVVIDFPGFGNAYPDGNEHRLAQFGIPQGHLPDPRSERTEAFNFNRWPFGCHSVTLIVAQQLDATQLTISPAKGYNAATLTWWYLLVDEDWTLPPGAIACYANVVGAVDGGADADSASVVP